MKVTILLLLSFVANSQAGIFDRAVHALTNKGEYDQQHLYKTVEKAKQKMKQALDEAAA